MVVVVVIVGAGLMLVGVVAGRPRPVLVRGLALGAPDVGGLGVS